MSVGTFGVLTAIRYSFSGELDLIISGLFIAGGIFGGWMGARIASKVPKRRLTQIFAVIVIIVAIYIIYQNFAVVLHMWIIVKYLSRTISEIGSIVFIMISIIFSNFKIIFLIIILSTFQCHFQVLIFKFLNDYVYNSIPSVNIFFHSLD